LTSHEESGLVPAGEVEFADGLEADGAVEAPSAGIVVGGPFNHRGAEHEYGEQGAIFAGQDVYGGGDEGLAEAVATVFGVDGHPGDLGIDELFGSEKTGDDAVDLGGPAATGAHGLGTRIDAGIVAEEVRQGGDDLVAADGAAGEQGRIGTSGSLILQRRREQPISEVGMKDELEFFDVETVPWRPDPNAPGVSERVLSREADGEVGARIARWAPGTGTSGVIQHDYFEEVLLLEGSLHDITLDRTFRAGHFASRPPGMPHGPYRTVDGCTMLEIRNRTADAS
jgi:hypothetical protein